MGRSARAKTSLYFVSIYRCIALAIAFVLMHPAGLYNTVGPEGWAAIGAVTAFAIYKIAHPLGIFKRRLPAMMEFGIDLTTCMALPIFTGGFESPFLVYTFSPVLSAALFFRMNVSLAVAGMPFLAIFCSHLWQHGLSLGQVFVPGSVSQFIMISYPAMSFILAAMPYFANINMYHQVKATAIAEERGRLSRDMHDGLAQSLSAARWRCEILKNGLKQDAGNAGSMEHLEFIIKTLEGAQKEARSAIDQLYRTSGIRQGLVPNLAQQATEYTREHGIQCHLDVRDAQVKLSELAEIQLICVAQEALNNIRKHAGAKSVHLSLVSSHGRTVMTINDDGLGFDPESISQGHGLRVMDERVRSIGGQMLVKTSRDHGTTITVEIEGSGPTEEEIL